MLGSIFPAKLHFRENKYRTDGLNPALAFILQKSSGLQKEKTGQIFFSESLSGNVPRRGLEPPRSEAPEPKSGVSAISPPGRLNYYANNLFCRQENIAFILPFSLKHHTQNPPLVEFGCHKA